jgi:outer membrane protein W
MPMKRQWAQGYSALIFSFLAACSALVLFACPLAAIQGPASARDGGRMAVGFLGGIGIANGYFASGTACGASFRYGLSRNIAVELAGFLISGTGEYDPETLSKGRLTIMPLQLSVLGRFPIGKKLTPYILAGGSYFFNRFSQNGSVAADWNFVGVTLTEKVHGAFGFHFGAGLEYRLGQALAVAFDTRYCLGKTNGEWKIKDNVSAVETGGTFSGINLDTMIFAVGLKYFLK